MLGTSPVLQRGYQQLIANSCQMQEEEWGEQEGI
jgi:hypothetical protein